MATKGKSTKLESKSKNDLDIVDMDEFNFDDIDSMADESVKKKDRKPVSTVFKGVVGGVASTTTNPRSITSAVKKALPSEYGVAFDAVDDITSNVSTLYNDSVKSIKPTAHKVFKEIDKLVPEELKRTKGFVKRLKDLSSSDDTTGPSAEQLREGGIQSTLAEIFTATAENDNNEKARDRAADSIRDKLGANRHQESTAILSSINLSLNRLSQYNDRVNAAYQKKSLELQLRSYYVQSDLLETTKKYSEIFKLQQDAIAKNTGLPDFLKLRDSERFKEMARTNLIEKANAKLFGNGSAINNAFKKVGAAVKEKIDRYKDAAMQGLSGFEMMNSMADPENGGEGKLAFGSEIAGNMGGEYLLNKAMKKLVDKFVVKGSKTDRFFNKATMAANNVQGTAAKWAKSDKLEDGNSMFANMFKGFARFFLENAKDDKTKTSLESTTTLNGALSDLNQNAVFDNLTKKSITTIIPGYLARILQAVSPKVNGAMPELLAFNHTGNKFIPSKEHDKTIKRQLTKEMDIGSYGRARKDFFKTVETKIKGKLSTSEKQTLSDIQEQILRDPDSLGTLEDYTNSKYHKGLDKTAVDKIRKLLTKAGGGKHEDGTANDIRYNRKVQESHNEVRSKINNLQAKIQKLIDTGDREAAINSGFVKIGRDGSLSVDTDAIGKMYASGGRPSDSKYKDAYRDVSEGSYGISKSGYATSDREAKENFSKFDPRGILGKMKKLAVTKWGYKKSRNEDDDKHIGPMAQDLQKSFGDDVAPDGKKIDLVSLNGTNMAAIGELAKEQDKLKKRGKGGKSSDIKTAADRIVDKLEEIRSGLFGSIAGKLKNKLSKMSLSDTLKSFFTRKHTEEEGEDFDPDSFVGPHQESGFSKLKSKAIHLKDKAKGSRTGRKLRAFANRGHKTMAGNAAALAARATAFILDTVHAAKGKASTGFDKAKDFINDHKDAVKELGGKLFADGSELLGKTYDLAKRAANDLLDNKIPGLSDFAHKQLGAAKDLVSDLINPVTDVYIKGETTPVLYATVLKAGGYADQLTGKILKKGTDIKGPVIDHEGNVVLSQDGLNKGLVDKNGDEIRSNLSKLARFMVAKTVVGFNFVKDSAIKLFNSVKGKEKPLFESFRNFFKDIASGIGGSGKDERVVNLLIQIRDTLNTRLEGEPTEYADIGPGPSSAMSSIAHAVSGSGKSVLNSEIVTKGKDKLKKVMAQGKEKLKKAKLKDKAKSIAEGIKKKGILSSLKGAGGSAFNSLKNMFNGTPNNPNAPVFNPNTGVYQRQQDGGFGAFSKRIDATYGPASAPTTAGGWLGNGKIGRAASWLSNSRGGKLVGMLGGKFKGIASAGMGMLGGMFGGGQDGEEKDVHTTDHGEQEAAHADEGKYTYNQVSRGSNNLANEDASTHKNKDGTRIGNASSLLAQLAERKKIEDSKKRATADLSAKYKGSKNVVDTLLDKAKGILGGIKGALGGLVNGVMAYATEKLASRALAKGAQVAGEKVAVQAAEKAGVRAAVWGATKLATRIGLQVGMRVLGIAAAGLLGIATAPIGGLLLAGTALWYAGKYLMRNNTDDTTDIRLRQYGLTEKNKSQYHLIFAFEDKLMETTKVVNKLVQLDQPKVNFQEWYDIFGIDKDNAEQVLNFGNWYNQRFRRIFFTHLTVLNGIDPKAKLKDVDKLPNDQKAEYVKAISFPDGPYDIRNSPFVDVPKLFADKSDVQVAIDKVLGPLKKNLDDEKSLAKKLNVPLASIDKNAGKLDKALSPKLPAAGAAAAATAAANKAANGDVNKPTDSEGKPAAGMAGGAAGASTRMTGGKIPLATGAMASGNNGSQYISLAKGVSIDQLNPAFLQNFKAMAEEYGTTTGKSILVTDGFRTLEQQKALKSKLGAGAAAPGNSPHEFGLALDINSSDLDALDKMGLMRKYGFTRPVGGETWHMEAAAMQGNVEGAKKDANLASELIASSIGKGGGGFGSIPGTAKGHRNMPLAVSLWDEEFSAIAVEHSKPDNLKPSTIPGTTTNSSTSNENTPVFKSTTVANVGALPAAQKATIGANIAANRASSKVVDFKEAEPGGLGKLENMSAVGTVNSPTEVKSLITKVSDKAGFDPQAMQAFAAVESSMNPNARAGGSSASGLYQFTNGTWDEMLSKYGPKHGLDKNASPLDPMASTLIAGEYMKANANALRGSVDNPTVTDLYLAHFLGPSGAKAFLKAPSDGIGANLFPKAASANREIFFEGTRARTIGEIYSLINNRIQVKSRAFGVNVQSGNAVSATTASKDTKGNNAGGIAAASPRIPGTVAAPTKGGDLSKPPSMGLTTKNSNVSVASTAAPVAASTPTPNQSGNNGLGNVDKVLGDSLNIQTQILGVLNKILTNVSPENLASIGDAIKKAVGGSVAPQPSVPQTPKAAPSSVPNSAVSMRRVMT
jgi:hypothetical protein